MKILQTLGAAALLLASSGVHAETNRRMSITFDDLPVSGPFDKTESERNAITADILDVIEQHQIPAIGFVNEDKLYEDGVLVESRVALLAEWVDAGLELGNHSYSHPDLHRVSLDEFQQDVLAGRNVHEKLTRAAGGKSRYFRHPFLHTGESLETKQAVERFLADEGYTVAPVTIDNSEWIFGRAYGLSLLANDQEMLARISKDYINYMLQMIDYYEDQSQKFFGRNISHILLLHAYALNAANFGALAQAISDRGYKFISLDEALEDPVFESDDAYVGPGGITWIHRWAITRGVKGSAFRGEPETPAYILEYAGLREHYYSE